MALNVATESYDRIMGRGCSTSAAGPARSSRRSSGDWRRSTLRSHIWSCSSWPTPCGAWQRWPGSWDPAGSRWPRSGTTDRAAVRSGRSGRQRSSWMRGWASLPGTEVRLIGLGGW